MLSKKSGRDISWRYGGKKRTAAQERVWAETGDKAFSTLKKITCWKEIPRSSWVNSVPLEILCFKTKMCTWNLNKGQKLSNAFLKNLFQHWKHRIAEEGEEIVWEWPWGELMYSSQKQITNIEWLWKTMNYAMCYCFLLSQFIYFQSFPWTTHGILFRNKHMASHFITTYFIYKFLYLIHELQCSLKALYNSITCKMFHNSMRNSTSGYLEYRGLKNFPSL